MSLQFPDLCLKQEHVTTFINCAQCSTSPHMINPSQPIITGSRSNTVGMFWIIGAKNAPCIRGGRWNAFLWLSQSFFVVFFHFHFLNIFVTDCITFHFFWDLILQSSETSSDWCHHLFKFPTHGWHSMTGDQTRSYDSLSKTIIRLLSPRSHLMCFFKTHTVSDLSAHNSDPINMMWIMLAQNT